MHLLEVVELRESKLTRARIKPDSVRETGMRVADHFQSWALRHVRLLAAANLARDTVVRSALPPLAVAVPAAAGIVALTGAACHPVAFFRGLLLLERGRVARGLLSLSSEGRENQNESKDGNLKKLLQHTPSES
jgi:hypothetical protein